MKEKRDGKEKLTSGQLVKNCLFAVGELFRNSPVFETLFVSELMIRTALAAFMSTFYVKILVNMLEKRAIIEEGTHDALLEKRGRYYEMWHAQADKYEI